MSEFVQRRQDGVSAHQTVGKARGRAGHEIQDLNPSDLPNVFSELYAIEVDI